MSDTQALQALMEQVREVFMQENLLLKAGRVAEYNQLMNQKAQLVGKLEKELKNLAQMRENKTHTDKSDLRALQDKIMQMLLIDRENEQLLIKKSMGNFKVNTPRVATHSLQQLTQKL